ncbi:DEKNAAC101180 [Brettanomyces naardenensis]|uniref:DEKNAAC101180 n=1 Tax=Brettanomyces naardenensis TaxID=13370 RepID=A0A448YH40_BRENA|nr:DEKNAAC101180 [Brettanomyces naardenensis]
MTIADDIIKPSQVDVVSANSGHAVNLTKIEVAGAEQFSDRFLQTALSPLLGSSDFTVSQLATSAESSASYFEGTECFKNVHFLIENDQDYKTHVSSLLALEVPLNLKVKLDLDPQPLKRVHVGSLYQSQLGNLVSLRYTNKNAFGDAKYVELGTTLSLLEDQKAKSIDATYRAPMADTSVKMFATGSFKNESIPAFQSRQQLATTATVGFEKSYNYAPTGISGSVIAGLAVAKLSVLDVADSANDEIKTYAGDNLKESLLLSADAGKLSFLPSSQGAFATEGSRVVLKNELAGFLPKEDNASTSSKFQDAFHKLELTGKYFRSLLDNQLTVACELGFGNLANLARNSKTVHFQDKFYVPIVGYKTLGLDKRATEKVGGLAYLYYKFSLYSRFLFASETIPLRAYASLTGAKLSENLTDLISTSTSDVEFKSTASLGMLYKVGDSAYCDIGYNWPLNNKEIDSTRPGLAVSVSLYGDY